MAAPKSVQKSCDLVIESVCASSLNYNLQETPYSIYLSIRKSSLKRIPTVDQEEVPQIPSPNKFLNKLEELESKLKSAEADNFALQLKYEDAVNDSEESYLKIKLLEKKLEAEVHKNEKALAVKIEKESEIHQSRKDNLQLKNEIVAFDKQWKAMNKTLKLKDKEINDLTKINSEIKTNLSEAEAKFTALTTKVNMERKVEAKNQKKREQKDFIDNLNEMKVYKCDKFNSKSETLDGLRSHVRGIHSRSVSTETEDNELEDKSAEWEPFGFWNEDFGMRILE
jgi:hypothetical protein